MSTIILDGDEDGASSLPESSRPASRSHNLAGWSAVSAIESHARSILIGALVVVIVGCLGITLFQHSASFNAHTMGWLSHVRQSHLGSLVARHLTVSVVVYPIAVLFIFMLERRFPAVPTQKILSTGLVHDVLWALMEGVFELVLLNWFVTALYKVYAQHLSFLTLPVPSSVPLLVRLAIGALALDLMRWWQHWVHHRLTFLWPFHAVHHSQPEINLFSNSRIHPVELLVSSALVVLPMQMLNVQAPAAIWYMLLMTWHGRLCHANIKTDFGPLRHIFVSPQSHRLHHSKSAEHFDQNYGALLSVWDRLFGTLCRRYDVYPETGVDDANFPLEQGHSVFWVLTSPLRQMLYPFSKLVIKRHPAAIAALAGYRQPVPPTPATACGKVVMEKEALPARSSNVVQLNSLSPMT